MIHEEFVSWLDQQVADEGLTAAQRDDLLEQKALFDANASANASEHPRKVVAYVACEKLVGGKVSEVLSEAGRKHPGRMTYFVDPSAEDWSDR